MKIKAALDIGTNSTLFLVARIEDSGKIEPLYHDVDTNDLGRGLDSNGYLTPEVIDKNIRLLRRFKRIADEYDVSEICIGATEALRRALNADVMIKRSRDELGLMINIISGEKEAHLTYRGILSGIPGEDRKIIAADIGGGSSEIIVGVDSNVSFATSIPVGAVVMSQKFIHHDPPNRNEIDQVRDFVLNLFSNLPGVVKDESHELVICGGTASSLAAADLRLSEYKPEKIAGYSISQSLIWSFIEQFASMTVNQRREIPGIGKRRAEIILPGAIIIDCLLTTLNRKGYITSERGLRYGLLVNYGKANDFA